MIAHLCPKQKEAVESSGDQCWGSFSKNVELWLLRVGSYLGSCRGSLWVLRGAHRHLGHQLLPSAEPEGLWSQCCTAAPTWVGI